MFAVPSGSSSCLFSLKVDNIVRCYNNLHQFLVLNLKSSKPELHRRKSEDCLTSALKSCSKSFVLDLLNLFEKSVGKPSSPPTSSDGSYTACEPGIQNFPRNAQEYKKYCHPRSTDNFPTKPIALQFYRKLLNNDDETSERESKFQTKRHTENYPILSGRREGDHGNDLMSNPSHPKFLDKDYDYPDYKEDFENYVLNQMDGNYDDEKEKLKSDENYAFYISEPKEEDLEKEERKLSDEEPKVKPLKVNAETGVKPSEKDEEPMVKLSKDDEEPVVKHFNEGEEPDIKPSKEKEEPDKLLEEDKGPVVRPYDKDEKSLIKHSEEDKESFNKHSEENKELLFKHSKDEDPVIRTSDKDEEPGIKNSKADKKTFFRHSIENKKPFIEHSKDEEPDIKLSKEEREPDKLLEEEEGPVIRISDKDKQPLIKPYKENQKPFVEHSKENEIPIIEHSKDNEIPIIEHSKDNEEPFIEHSKDNEEPFIEHSKDEEPRIKSSKDETLDELSTTVVDGERSSTSVSPSEKGLMFRSLSNDIDDKSEKEESHFEETTSGEEILRESSTGGREESNEISKEHEESLKKTTDSPKKSDDCTVDDFDSYLDPLFDCQNIRMSLLSSSEQNATCNGIVERSFESLALCLFEHKVALGCEVNSKEQIEDFLSFLSLRLGVVTNYYRKQCSSTEPPCYASGIQELANCSDHIYNHLKEPSAVRGALKVYRCLASTLPKCSSEIPLLLLPSIYLPLGMNLSTVLQETEEKRCLAATTKDIPISSICTEADKETATQSVFSCLDRTNLKINESLQDSNQTLQWSVLPMTVCVSVYPILECRQTDLDQFKQFMTAFLTGIKSRLEVFFKYFIAESDKKKGEDCLLQFTSPNVGKCLTLMFEYMTSFHSGFARASDYPSACVDEIFGKCGDVDIFHLLIKKSMNLTSEEEDPMVRTCMREENKIYLKNCDSEQFSRLLSSEEKCREQDAKRGDVFIDAEDPIDFCKSCILRNIEEMCTYEMPRLKEVVSSALESTEKCLKTQNVEKTCVQDVKTALEDKCLFDFHTYVSHVKRGRYMKAAHFSRNTYDCLNKTVTHCPPEVQDSIFNLYSRISGVESISNYRTDYMLGLSRAVNEMMVV